MDKLKAHVERWRNNSDSARLSVKLGDLRELISRLESAEKSLMPFKVFVDQIETQGPRGTWASTELDNFRKEFDVHPWPPQEPKQYDDDFTLLSAQVEVPGGVGICELDFGHFRAARAHMEKYHGR